MSLQALASTLFGVWMDDDLLDGESDEDNLIFIEGKPQSRQFTTYYEEEKLLLPDSLLGAEQPSRLL